MRTTHQPEYYAKVEACVDEVLTRLDKKVILGIPIALGKSHHFCNIIYRKAKEDPSIDLTFATALSLEKPGWSSDLERRIIEPLADRIWKGIPDFDYMTDLRADRLPANVKLLEFYFKAGSVNKVTLAQQNHCASNYTHIARDMMELADNLVYCHCVSQQEIDGEVLYSDSCNSDLTRELKRLMPIARAKGKTGLHIGVVNNNLPFMYGDAVNNADAFDMIISDDACHVPLFSAPKTPVVPADHAIGLHVSSLVPDDATLQIGIGSLGDAIANALLLRQNDNAVYRKILSDMEIDSRYEALIKSIGGLSPFDKGLYGCTEMLVDVFIRLYEGGVIKRKVYNQKALQELIDTGTVAEALTPEGLDELFSHPDLQPVLKADDFRNLRHHGIFQPDCRYKDWGIEIGGNRFDCDLRTAEGRRALIENCCGPTLKRGVITHGGFFIGPTDFYNALRNMPEEERQLFEMTGVDVVNHLYGDEALRTVQRKRSRFCNTCMKITLMGNIASDALENGTVISGVGGQYNFVSQAHALDGARLIMMLRSVKDGGAGGPQSNIVFNYGYTTIPRHLKDLVITEYGIADLRGRVDVEVVQRLLNIADSRFQEDLLRKAKQAGKLPQSYSIPDRYRQNTPRNLEKRLAAAKADKRVPIFPFGTEFTNEEIVLGKSLRIFKAQMNRNKVRMLGRLLGQFMSSPPDAARPYLERMALDNPQTRQDRFQQAIVVTALKGADSI